MGSVRDRFDAAVDSIGVVVVWLFTAAIVVTLVAVIIAAFQASK